MKSDVIDFEDFFYTRETWDAAIRDIYRSFDSLYQANKKVKYITNEYKAFKAFVDKALKDGAPLVGGNSQIEGWQKRYKIAYSYASNKSGPDPGGYEKPFQLGDLMNSPWAWVGGAIFLSIVVSRLTK